MNRAEQRRLAKEQKKKTVKYNLSKKLSNEELERIIDEAANKKMMEVLQRFAIAFALALNDEFGFGKKRISRAINKSFSNIEAIGTGNLNLEDLETWKNEMGLDTLEV